MRWVRFGLTLMGLASFDGLAAVASLQQGQPSPVPLEVLEDPSRALEFAEVAQSEFVTKPGPHWNVGYSRSAFWLRFTLENDSPRSREAIAEIAMTTDEATLYSRSLTQPDLKIQHTGKRRAFNERDVQVSNLAFHVDLAPNERREFFMRVVSDDTVTMGATVSDSNAFWARVATERLWLGLYFGFIFAMAVYNLYVFALTKDRPSLWYAAFQISMAFFFATFEQITAQYFWPGAAGDASRGMIFASGLIVLNGVQFAFDYLRLDRAPRMFRLVLRGGQVAAACLALAAFVETSSTIWTIGAFIVMGMSVLVFSSGVYAWVNQSENAPLFVMAWAVLLGSGVLSGLGSLGILPSLAHTIGVVRVGSAIDAFLLAIAVALRLRREALEAARRQNDILMSRNTYASQLEEEVKLRTAELSAALEQGRALDRAKSEFFANISHDLRNPLAVITGPLSALNAPSKLGPADQHLVSLALGGAQRLDSMISDLLDLAQIDAGAARLHPSTVDIVSLVRNLVLQLEPHADSLNVELSVDVPSKPIFCELDVEKLERVLMNLLSNAFKHAASARKITVRLVEEGAEGRLRISVEDDGVGINADDVPRLFERFSRSQSSQRNVPGVGLGLAVVKDLIELLGGDISVRSAPGLGAVFTLTLPRRSPSDVRGTET